MGLIRKIKYYIRSSNTLLNKIEFLQEALGSIETRQLLLTRNDASLEDHEFKVYSQSGEEGIIQYLVAKMGVTEKTFIEFGVENYTESNTRFLALNNYWAGLVINGSIENINYTKRDPISWRRNLTAYHSFITKDDTNDIITRNGFSGKIGLLSIDMDGNDYWSWENLTVTDAAIVVCEYNSILGPKANITVPYNESFIRSQAYYSMIYYGTSITALYALGVKGYSLVWCNRAGNDIFFVRNYKLNGLKPSNPHDVYRRTHFREIHDEEGRLQFADFSTAQAHLLDLDIYDLGKNTICKIRNVV